MKMKVIEDGNIKYLSFNSFLSTVKGVVKNRDVAFIAATHAIYNIVMFIITLAVNP